MLHILLLFSDYNYYGIFNCDKHIYANYFYIFNSHLKGRSKHCGFLSLVFIIKSKTILHASLSYDIF